jgi:soluble lytic murein transglycosylase-like protein
LPDFPLRSAAPRTTRTALMFRNLSLTTILVAFATAASPAFAQKQRSAILDANGNLDALVARHAAANNLPEDLVRRVIKRESGGNPRAVSQGNYGLMQIKLATARGMGYTGTAAGLLDADTNMTYAVKYLAGAYRVANGNASRAVHYYAAGYYYAAKNKGIAMPSTAQAYDSFAAPGSIKFGSEQKLRATYARGDGTASSSSLYTGKPDYY